ncbi:hypothetical protein ES703_108367 [subsurface metagenome]
MGPTKPMAISVEALPGMVTVSVFGSEGASGWNTATSSHPAPPHSPSPSSKVEKTTSASTSPTTTMMVRSGP